MAKDRRRKETRTYTRTDGQTKDYEVYFVESRDSAAIEESEILTLGMWAGCKEFIISKPTQAVEDNMFWADKQFDRAKRDGITLPARGIRYIAYCSCMGPDGSYYEDSGNAAADNIDMRPMRVYAPELATKRARVRCVILALGLKGLNADVEFPDQDKADASAKEVKKSVKALDDFIEKLKITFKEAKIPAADRENVLEELGMNKPLNQLTEEEKSELLVKIANYNKNDDGAE